MVTDHSALKWLQTSKMPSGQRARWIMELQQHHFTIEHQPEKANNNADALFRMYNQTDEVQCLMVNAEYYEEEIASPDYQHRPNSKENAHREKSMYTTTAKSTIV